MAGTQEVIAVIVVKCVVERKILKSNFTDEKNQNSKMFDNMTAFTQILT